MPQTPPPVAKRIAGSNRLFLRKSAIIPMETGIEGWRYQSRFAGKLQSGKQLVTDTKVILLASREVSRSYGVTLRFFLSVSYVVHTTGLWRFARRPPKLGTPHGDEAPGLEVPGDLQGFRRGVRDLS
jgi:hypothetical protein